MGLHHDRSRTNPAPGAVLPALLTVLLALCALAAPRAAAEEKLSPIEPDQLGRSDQLGFQWDFNIQGALRDGTNDCFDGGMSLRVAGHAFNATEALQSDGGEELVLRGEAGAIGVTRRIRIDMAKGAARYVEVLQNRGAGEISAAVEVKTMLGSSAQSVLTDQGRGASNGPLEKREVGLVALHGGGTRPGVLFQLSTPRSRVTPTIVVENNRAFTFTWTVEIPAGESVALVHSLAQRR